VGATAAIAGADMTARIATEAATLRKLRITNLPDGSAFFRGRQGHRKANKACCGHI
jgi:hypothetical protein